MGASLGKGRWFDNEPETGRGIERCDRFHRLGSDSGRRAGIPTPSTHKLATTTIAQGCTRHFLACNSDWHFTGSLCGAAGVSFIGSSGGNGVTIGFFTSKLNSQCQVFPDLHSEYLHIRMLEIGFLLKMAPISWLLEGHIAVLV